MEKEEMIRSIFDHLGGFENVANTVNKDDGEDEKLFNSPETKELALKRNEVRRRIVAELVKFVSEIAEYADVAGDVLTISEAMTYENGPLTQIIKILWKLYLNASKCEDIDKLSTLSSSLDGWFERLFNYSKNMLNLPVPEDINELLKDKDEDFTRSFAELVLEASEEITNGFEDIESMQNFLSGQETSFKNLIDELDQLAVGL